MSNLGTIPLQPGKIKIQSVYHITEMNTADITRTVVEINLHSSIVMGSSVATLSVNDFTNYLVNGNVQPGDTFKISIAYHDETIHYTYKLASVMDIVNFQSGKSYNLKLISELEYYSIYRAISKGFIGQTSEIARTIFAENTEEKYNIWEPSVGNETVCIPSWSPMRTIKWLAGRSRSSTSPSRFVFFQDSRQRYNFLSIEKLRELYTTDPITYVYNNNNLGEQTGTGIVPNSEKTLTTIFDLDFLDLYDINKAYKSGVMRNTKIRTDFTTKTVDYLQNSYWDTYQSKNLNKSGMWPYEDTAPGKIHLENTVYNSSPTGGFNKISDETSANPDFDRSQQIEITVIGNNGVDIGMTVGVKIPSMEVESSVKQHVFDPIWSGRYYVTGKRDVIDRSGHQMILRLAKGSKANGAI